jgi:hypothetical protein
MGFERDFAHSQLTLAHCIRHLSPFERDEPIRLDVAIKGPVYYGSNVTLNYSSMGKGRRFDLYCGENPRPCVMGSLETGEPDLDLIRDTYSWIKCR